METKFTVWIDVDIDREKIPSFINWAQLTITKALNANSVVMELDEEQ